MGDKRAQLWGVDLMIAGIIFSVALSFFYLYAVNSVPESEETFRTLSYEGGSITDLILSEGFPMDWNETSVVEPGILTNGKVNSTKLEQLYNLTLNDYAKAKVLLNTPNDFYFFFDGNMTLNGQPIDGLGKPGVNRSNISSRNLIKVSRVVIYEDKLSGAVLYLWN